MERDCSNGMPALRPLLAILLLAGMLSATTSYDFTKSGERSFETRMGGWMPIAVAAILVCVFANALVYMSGTFLQSQSIKNYAKAEFIQVTASALLIFFAVALIYTLSGGTVTGLSFMQDLLGRNSGIACDAQPGGTYFFFNNENFGGGPLGAYKCKLQEKITALDAAYNNVYESNMPDERLASTTISIFGVPIYVGDWSMSLHTRVEQNHLIATKIVGLLMPLHAQYALAQYMQNNMLAVFLPLGLLLRIIPFTRGIGGLFIAIAIGFFFVWPTFFILSDPTYVKADAIQKELQKGMCFTGFKGASTVLANALLTSSIAGGNSLALSSGTNLVYEITIATLFYPFVALVITLIFIRAVTPLLGGDTGELMRMVSRLG